MREPGNFKGVIFDLDGVIVKPFTPETIGDIDMHIATLRNCGIQVAIATNQAGPLWLWATSNRKYPNPIRLAANIRAITQALGDQDIPWFISLADRRVLEMTDADSYDYQLRQIEKELSSALPGWPLHTGITEDWRKPAAGMLLAVAGYWGIAPADILYMGDMESDRQAASAAGMQFEMVETPA